MDAIFYVLRSGCAWRMLPHDLPPWKTVYHYFCLWRQDGTWVRINDVLRTELRVASGRDPQPSAALVLEKVKDCSPNLRLIWADGGYAGQLETWVKTACGRVLEIIKRKQHATGFQVMPRRWVVERTFAWLGKYRRLSKDYEAMKETSEAFIYAAMVHLMVRRLARTSARSP